LWPATIEALADVHAAVDAHVLARTVRVTRFGSAAEDDDCKYHVEWTSTPVTKDADVTFAVTATHRATAAAVTAAALESEVYLDDTHPAPDTDIQTIETAPGHYTLGPVRFDAPGRWTIRLHVASECNDAVRSPHGHVAFFVNVP
jgi:hypothetical protein